MAKKMIVRPFGKLADRTVFRILKEQGRSKVEPGVWVKLGNSRSRAFSGTKQIILALGDMCEVIQFKKRPA